MKLIFVCCFILLIFGAISGYADATTIEQCVQKCLDAFNGSHSVVKRCKSRCKKNPEDPNPCFSAHSTVVTSQGIQKTMYELKIGDEISVVDPANGKLTFSPVITFLDRKPNHETYFHLITTETEEKLTVTPIHLVYSYSDIGTGSLQNEIIPEQIDFSLFKAIFAKNISVGDLVLAQTNNGQLKPTRVSKIETQMHNGAYAPLTEMGTLVVDNILASCYANVDSHWLAHIAVSPIRLLAKVWPNDQLVDGIHWYAQSLHSLVEFVMPSILASH